MKRRNAVLSQNVRFQNGLSVHASTSFFNEQILQYFLSRTVSQQILSHKGEKSCFLTIGNICYKNRFLKSRLFDIRLLIFTLDPMVFDFFSLNQYLDWKFMLMLHFQLRNYYIVDTIFSKAQSSQWVGFRYHFSKDHPNIPSSANGRSPRQNGSNITLMLLRIRTTIIPTSVTFTETQMARSQSKMLDLLETLPSL